MRLFVVLFSGFSSFLFPFSFLFFPFVHGPGRGGTSLKSIAGNGTAASRGWSGGKHVIVGLEHGRGQ